MAFKAIFSFKETTNMIRHIFVGESEQTLEYLGNNKYEKTQ